MTEGYKSLLKPLARRSSFMNRGRRGQIAALSYTAGRSIA